MAERKQTSPAAPAPRPRVTGTGADDAFWFVVVWPDGRQERWPYRWQATARMHNWTAPANGSKAAAPVASAAIALGAEAAAIGTFDEYEVLADALRRVVPPRLLAEVIAHLPPLAGFLTYLRATCEEDRR